MSDFKVEWDDDELQAALKKLADPSFYVPGMRLAARMVMGRVKKYPPKVGKGPDRKSVYGTTFVSEKQRRFFFAALKDGRIEIPYHRGEAEGTERHGASWEISEESGGLVQVIGSDTSYGPYLQSADKQSLYMKAVGWETAEDVLKRSEGEIVQTLAVTAAAMIAQL